MDRSFHWQADGLAFGGCMRQLPADAWGGRRLVFFGSSGTLQCGWRLRCPVVWESSGLCYGGYDQIRQPLVGACSAVGRSGSAQCDCGIEEHPVPMLAERPVCRQALSRNFQINILARQVR